MSERESTVLPQICSGDMWAGVPTIWPGSVSVKSYGSASEAKFSRSQNWFSEETVGASCSRRLWKSFLRLNFDRTSLMATVRAKLVS